jgi:response regulator RpfG family c-di-GMP phosphodiesterase
LCKTRQDKTRQDPENALSILLTGLRSRAKAALQRQSLALPDGSTLPTEELQKLVHEIHDSYKREPGKISSVIQDLIMPNMIGQERPEEILKIDPKAKFPIATAVSLDDERTELAIDSGARESIHQPYHTTKSLTAVRDILNKD